MKILVIGGTGAMGVPLVDLLSQNNENRIFVTSRSNRDSCGNIFYIKGNAKDECFFKSLLDEFYDVIIDFLVYNTEQLKKRLPVFLEHTKQYFFFSSARCYADSQGPITEESDRLVDVCMDTEYLATDEYGLAKGREENILKSCGKKNWTIIRPYITYNQYRLQLGVYEKENWLKRALEGRTIVFPRDIAESKTSLTYGPDVAQAIIGLIGNEKAYGEAFHITTEESHTWEEILEHYLYIIEKNTGKRPKVKYLSDSKELQKIWNPWQIKYDRLYDRIFDNSKFKLVRGVYEYKPTFAGLELCLSEFIKNPEWREINIRFEAWCDRQTGEITPIWSFSGIRAKARYIKWRFFCKS